MFVVLVPAVIAAASSGIFEAIFGGIGVVVVGWIGSTVANRRREKKTTEKTFSEKVNETYEWTFGLEPTKALPNPPPGGRDRVVTLEAAQKDMAAKLETLLTRLTRNGGHDENNVADALHRIEQLLVEGKLHD